MKYKSIFNPKTIAVVGATDRQGSVGGGLVKNLLKGKRKIYLINPFRKSVFGHKTYPEVSSVKGKIDLAVIAVPAKVVLKIARECAQEKVGGVIIISAGFAETGALGRKLQDKIAKTLKDIPLIGPNCLGIIRPSLELNASFAPATPRSGGIAFLSQSGALIDSVIAQSLTENYGFSTIVSYGNEAGLELRDFLEWTGRDKKTKVIAIYIEGLKNGRRFFETAKAVAKNKPIIVLKGGKSKAATKAVSSHTGAMAGTKEIYSAAFKQAGLIEVNSLEELFDVSKALSWQPRCRNNIGIVTNGGGAGILAVDYCQQFGINLTKLSQKTTETLEKSKKMHSGWSRGNPLDIVGDALSERYKVALNALLKQKNIYGLMVIQTHQIMTEPVKNAKIIIEAKRKWPKKAIITALMGGKLNEKAVELLEKNKIPNYSDPMRATKALKGLIN